MKFLSAVALILLIVCQSAGQTVVTIGNGIVGSSRPLNSGWGYVRTVDLYLASEIGTTGNITAVAWDKFSGTSLSPTSYAVYMKATAATTVPTYDWATLISGATTVSSGTFQITSSGGEWYGFTLDSPFTLGAAENLLVICSSSAGGSGTGGGETFLTTAATNMSGTGITDDAPQAVLFAHTRRLNVRLTFGALPVQLVSLTATTTGADVMMQWRTASEVNNYGFYVQMRRPGETVFVDLPGVFVAGHGTTVEPQEYTCRIGMPGPAGTEYRLKQVDLDGSVHFSESVTSGVVAGVEGGVPATYFLARNYPNPFNPSTTISYGLPQTSQVLLTVYNALGEEVARPVDGIEEAGMHSVSFDAPRVASGVLYYRLQAGGHNETRRMILLR
jgi:hypothetical protein